MSHNYPYRRPPSDSDLRPDPGPYSSSDRRHTSPDNTFFRPPQESFPSSYQSSSSASSSSSSSRGAQWSQDGVLGILSSCGLEPSDLGLLAKLPEDVLTVESLPHVLNQIKGKRGTIKPFPPNAPSPSSSSSSSSYPRSSAHRPTARPSTSDWDHPPRQLIQYPVDHLAHNPLPSDQDRWGNPRTRNSIRSEPSSSSSSSSSYVVDFHHRPGPSDYGKTDRHAGPVSSLDYNHRPGPSQYGKTGRDAGPVSSQVRTSLSSTEGGNRTRSSRFSQPGPADHRSAPPEEYHPKTSGGGRESETSSIRSSNRLAASMPSKKEALDFHGTSPTVFPYSCSLCDITVMSERVWFKHINNTQHADGQLSLLQQFPNWDCRLETVSRADNQSERWKDEGKPVRQHQTANQDPKTQPDKNSEKKTSEKEKGKVVCVKFPPQSVDEAYLRKLTEPFGKVVKILMFPSLAFVELGSVDQAKDLVKFHVNYPPTVNGEQMEFRISKTFNFLQSSRVVSFTPPPTGENGQSDLMSIVKRFGPPLYTLLLPSAASVEMKNAPDAQKLVDYYSSNTLRINDDIIKVSFSGEYNSLMRVPSAKRYEEETSSAKRPRSSSREKKDKTAESKKRRSSKDREEEEEGETSGRESKNRTRSGSRERSREKSGRERRSRSREKRSRSKSREKSTKEKTTRTRSRSRERSREKSNRERRSRSREKSSRERGSRTRSKSREKSSGDRGSRSKSRSREKLVVPVKTEPTDSESRTDPGPAPVRDAEPEAEKQEQTEEEAESSADESDIEGMEVIGEDGENLEDEDMEALDDAEEEEEGGEEGYEVGEGDETDDFPAERTDSPEEDKEEVKEELTEKEEEEKPVEEEEVCGTKKQEEETEETAETQLEDDEEEPDCPIDLENCITLDEVEEDETDDRDEEVGEDATSLSTRVLYFRNLPLSYYTDVDFVKLVKDFGTASRYFMIRRHRKGFIEMSTSSEALRAAKELSSKPAIFNGCRLYVQLSNKYRRLNNGWAVQSDEDEERRSECRTRSSRRSERQNRDESSRKSEGRKESTSKKSPEKESTSKTAVRKSTEKETVEVLGKNTREKESVGKNSSDRTSRTTPENESVNKKTPEKELASKKTPERAAVPKTNSKKKPVSKKTPEKESRAKKSQGEKESVSERTPEKDSRDEKSQEKDSETKSEKESVARTTSGKTCRTAEKVSAAKKGPEEKSLPETSHENKPSKRKGTDENRSGPEKRKKESSDETQTKPELEIHEKKGSEEGTPGPGPKDSKSPDPPDSTGDPTKPQTEQEPADQLQSGPAGGAAELQNPPKPVGTEFVRPVVGYFCNLCQLIYADEDEAKLQHCSSPTHYRKYQEKTGKDPWAS